jgi:hypothetical protein
MVHVRRYAEQTANHDVKQRAEVSEWFGTVKAAWEVRGANPGPNVQGTVETKPPVGWNCLTNALAMTYCKS